MRDKNSAEFYQQLLVSLKVVCINSVGKLNPPTQNFSMNLPDFSMRIDQNINLFTRDISRLRLLR